MLTFKSLADLREYLETRKKMAARQIPLTERKSHASGIANGMEFAFEESIKALDAFIESQKPQGESARILFPESMDKKAGSQTRNR